MAEPLTLVPGLAPAAPLMRVLSQFNRAKIEAFAEVAIALLDLADGDPDAETEALEDDFTLMPADLDLGPGCSIADPAGHCPTEDCLGGTPYVGASFGPGCPISDPAEWELVR